MSVDLGAVVARVVLEDVEFRRTVRQDIQILRDFGAQAGKSAAGTASLDDSLAGVSASATKASSSIARASRVTVESAAANVKDAKASIDNARAKERLAAFQAQIASMSTKEQQAALRSAAAQERVAEVNASSTASYRQLAAAEASAMGATRALATANEAAAVSSKATASAFGGLLHTAAELGVVVGGIELAKKTIEFVGAGRELTTALNGIQAASHATDAQMGAVRKQAVGLGKDMTVPAATAVDAADAIQDLVRAGMTLPRAMAASRSALLLASAAQVSTADGARYLGDILDDFGLSGDQAAHVANVLAGAATSAGGGLSDMFTAMKYAGPVARAAGVNVDELSTAIAMLAKSGIQGDQAGTGLRSMMLSLAGPTKQQAAGFRALGITTKDAAGNLLPLPKLLDDLHAAQERMTRADFLAAIKHAFGKPATSVVASFAHQGIDGYDRFAARVASGDVQKYADLMNRGLSATGKQIGKEFTAAGIDIYEKFEPKLVAVAATLAVDLPHAFDATMSMLHPLGVALGFAADGLGELYHFGAEVVGALGPAAPVLEAVGQAAVLMFAAFKGYQLARAALFAVQDGLAAVSARVGTGLASLDAWEAGAGAAFSGSATEAKAAALSIEADFAAMAAGVASSVAETDAAFAAEAEAYAQLVMESDAATATMISNSQNAAAAAQAQAAASAEAAAEVAVAADAAAASVAEAGDTAALGWGAIAGPIGIAAVGVGIFATAMLHSSGATKQNAAEIQSLTSAIQADSGALGENTRQTVINALNKNGALKAARELGLSLSDVTTATLEGGPALKALTDQIALYSYGTYGATKDTSARTAAARLLLSALGDENGAVGQAAQGARDEAAAQGKSTTATNSNTTARQSNTSTTTNNATAVRKLAAAEVALISVLLSQAQSQDQFLESLRSTSQQLKSNNGSLSKNTATGLANRDALLASVQAAMSLKDAQDKAGGSTVAHTRTLANNIASLKAAAIAAGADKGQVDKLLTSLHATPKEIRSSIKVDTTSARRNAQSLLDWLRSQVVVVHVTSDAQIGGPVVLSGTSGTRFGLASGGGLPPGFASVGERGPELVYTSGGSSHVFSNAQSKAIVAATGMSAPGFNAPVRGFAGGTLPVAAQQIAAALASVFKFGRNQIAGVLGDLKVESGFRSTAYNARENAHGFAQWEGSRWTALQKYAKSLGESATGTKAQIGFLVKELRGSGLASTIKKMGDPARIAALVDARYERSSGSTRKQREAAAVDIAAALKHVNLAKVPGPSLHSLLPAATKTVLSQIAAAVKPPVTSVSGLSRVLGSQTGTAATQLAKSRSDAAVYREAAAQLKAAKDQAAKLKAVWDKQSQAAKDAEQKAADTAKTLIQTVSDQATALLQKVSDFESTIAQGIAQGSDLATVWGNLATSTADANQAIYGGINISDLWTGAVQGQTDAATNLADAQQAVADAQKAINDATPDPSVLLGARAAQEGAQAVYDAAHARLAAAQAAVAGGVGTPAQYAAVTTAQQAQSDAVSGLAYATTRLTAAQQAVAQATGPTTDQIQALTDAQTKLTLAQTAATAAGTGQAAGLQDTFAAWQQQITAAAGFATDLGALSAHGLNASLIGQIRAMGPAVGDALAQAIIAGGPAAITQANTLSAQVTAALTAPPTDAELQAQFKSVLAGAQTFASDLTRLANEGGNQDLLTQIAGMGPDAGDQLAKAILAAGPGGIKALQATMASIGKVAGTEGDALAGVFFSKGEGAMAQLIAGLEARFPDLKAALAPIAALVDQTLNAENSGGKVAGTTKSATTKYAHALSYLATAYKTSVATLVALNPSLAGDTAKTIIGKGTHLTIPAFAAGVTNFAGGIALVGEAGPEIVDLPPRSNVHPHGQSPFGGIDFGPVVRRLEAIEDRLAAAPSQTGRALAEANAGMHRQVGQAVAAAQQRYARKGGR